MALDLLQVWNHECSLHHKRNMNWWIMELPMFRLASSGIHVSAWLFNCLRDLVVVDTVVAVAACPGSVSCAFVHTEIDRLRGGTSPVWTCSLFVQSTHGSKRSLLSLTCFARRSVFLTPAEVCCLRCQWILFCGSVWKWKSAALAGEEVWEPQRGLGSARWDRR